MNKKMQDAVGFILCILISLYRYSLSYFLGRQCRFLPTCSEYADEAIRLHGPGKGAYLALRRFCRCYPWGGSGYDPVPAIISAPKPRFKGVEK